MWADVFLCEKHGQKNDAVKQCFINHEIQNKLKMCFSPVAE